MMDQAERAVRGFLTSFGNVGLEELLRFFAGDVHYQDARPGGIYEGIDALGHELAEQLKSVPSTEITIKALVSDGHTVMVEREEAFAMHGKPVRLAGAIVFEVNEAGKIARIRDYYDRGQFAAQLKD